MTTAKARRKVEERAAARYLLGGYGLVTGVDPVGRAIAFPAPPDPRYVEATGRELRAWSARADRA